MLGPGWPSGLRAGNVSGGSMDDPIVKEVREAREQLARKFDYNLHAIFSDIRERQKALGIQLVPTAKKAEPIRSADKAADA